MAIRQRSHVRASSRAFDFGDEIHVRPKENRSVAAREVVGPQDELQRRIRLPLIGRENDLAQLQLPRDVRSASGGRRWSALIAPRHRKDAPGRRVLDWLPSLAPNGVVATPSAHTAAATYWRCARSVHADRGQRGRDPPRFATRSVLGCEHWRGGCRARRQALARPSGSRLRRGQRHAVRRLALRLEAVARRTPLVVVFETALSATACSTWPSCHAAARRRAVLMIRARRRSCSTGGRRGAEEGATSRHRARAARRHRIADLVRHLLDTMHRT